MLRQTLTSDTRDRLQRLVAREGQQTVAAAVPCSPVTIRHALGGGRLNPGTVRLLSLTLASMEGATAHLQAA